MDRWLCNNCKSINPNLSSNCHGCGLDPNFILPLSLDPSGTLNVTTEDPKITEIINYCKPHLEMMWAAKIVSIILDCDFRDCKEEIQRRGL